MGHAEYNKNATGRKTVTHIRVVQRFPCRTSKNLQAYRGPITALRAALPPQQQSGTMCSKFSLFREYFKKTGEEIIKRQ